MNRKKILLLMSLICLLIITACNENDKKAEVKGELKITKVVTEYLKPHKFEKQIQIKGTIKPINKAFISAKTGGIIDSLYVKEGDYVKKSDLLFQTDKVNLENAVISAKKIYETSEKIENFTNSDIPVALANKEKIELDYKRDKDLYKNDAISKSELERTEVNFKSAIANLEKAKALNSASKTLMQQLVASLEIAEKNLSDSKVLAPYNGYVVSKKMNIGEYALPGMPVLEIENNNDLEIACRLSAVYYDKITDETILNIRFAGETLAIVPVTYKSPNIDTFTRTFEIKALVPNQKGVISGLLCDVGVVLEQHEGMGINSNAIIPHKDGKSVIYIVKEGKAVETEVKTGLTKDNITEIVDFDKIKEEKIISEGHFYLNNGDLVSDDGGAK